MVPGSIIKTGVEIDDGVLFKPEIFVKCVVNLFGYQQGRHNKHLCDDKLGYCQGFAQTGTVALASLHVYLVLQYLSCPIRRKDQGRVKSG